MYFGQRTKRVKSRFGWILPPTVTQYQPLNTKHKEALVWHIPIPKFFGLFSIRGLTSFLGGCLATYGAAATFLVRFTLFTFGAYGGYKMNGHDSRGSQQITVNPPCGNACEKGGARAQYAPLLMRTMSAISKDAAQTSTYTRQLRENVKTILDNYAEVLKASKASLWKLCKPNGELIQL